MRNRLAFSHPAFSSFRMRSYFRSRNNRACTRARSHQVASGKMGPAEYVRATSAAAAWAFNIYPRKGRVAVGSDGDIILMDPEATTTVRCAEKGGER